MGAIGRMFFDEEYDRYFVDEIGLHCGDVIQILVVDDDGEPKWETTSIEKGLSGWYAVGFSKFKLDGLWAYLFDDDGEDVVYEYTIDPETGPQYEC